MDEDLGVVEEEVAITMDADVGVGVGEHIPTEENIATRMAIATTLAQNATLRARITKLQQHLQT